ncbi:MAG TPA: hypothetical protein DEH78_33165 [Solibacterales bacterium]|nr:hypothetical protein [Bryobacterales bacterium]
MIAEKTNPTMNSPLPALASNLEIPVTEIREQVERMLACDLFSRSERMSRFLQFTVEQSLAGKASNLKEYLIGVEVFDKPETLDPRLDPIVRVEAGRLRAKLREYYETDGRDDRILIAFPPRSYAPSFQRRPDAGLARESSAYRGQMHAARASLAVLPFADLSRNRDQDYFCDGLTEEVIGAVAQLRPLRVVSRTSTLRFKGKADDVRTIGEQLNVRTVLEGSVRRLDQRLRITVLLADAADGYHLWSETFDRTAEDDIFTLQREIASAISSRVREHLAPPVASVQ